MACRGGESHDESVALEFAGDEARVAYLSSRCSASIEIVELCQSLSGAIQFSDFWDVEARFEAFPDIALQAVAEC